MAHVVRQLLTILWDATWTEIMRRPLLLLAVGAVLVTIISPATTGRIVGNTAVALIGPLTPLFSTFLFFYIVYIGIRVMFKGLIGGGGKK